MSKLFQKFIKHHIKSLIKETKQIDLLTTLPRVLTLQIKSKYHIFYHITIKTSKNITIYMAFSLHSQHLHFQNNDKTRDSNAESLKHIKLLEQYIN